MRASTRVKTLAQVRMAVNPGNTSFFPKILKAIAQGTINVGPDPPGKNRMGCAISLEKTGNVVAYPRPLARDFAVTAKKASSALSNGTFHVIFEGL